jgi:IS1 family transposase
LPEELVAEDCWIALSLAQLSGLILTGRVGKHTNELAAELVLNTQGKTECKEWHTDGWSGYERVLCDCEIEHYISKALTQRSERTNGILRQLSWADGIGDEINSVSCGTRQKSPYV